MELLDAIKGRRAVRDFTDKPVDTAVVTNLLEAAVLAPSALDEQPWLFTVIRDRALIDRISGAAKEHWLKSYDGGAPLGALLKDPDFHLFYRAPAVIAVSAAAGRWAVIDCALAAQNLMLAAFANGIGTCWIGFAEGWLNTAEGKAEIDVPGSHQVVAPIALGYPKAFPAAPYRDPPQIAWRD
jgi:nitroreductase